MAVKTREEIMEMISSLLGERTDDEALTIMEDISDSYGDSSEEITRLQTENENLRQRYRERFMNREEREEPEEKEEPEEIVHYEDLFKKEEE